MTVTWFVSNAACSVVEADAVGGARFGAPGVDMVRMRETKRGGREAQREGERERRSAGARRVDRTQEKLSERSGQLSARVERLYSGFG